MLYMNHVIQHIDTPPRLLTGGGGWSIFSGDLFSWWPIFLVAYFFGGLFSPVAYFLNTGYVEIVPWAAQQFFW